MRSAFAFLWVLLASSPAYALTGTLEVKSGSLRVMREDGMKVHFYPGKYKADIDFDSSQVNVMIERKEVRTDAVVKYPAGTQIPENGEVIVDGLRSGQTFAITGNISTVRNTTPSEQGQESCTTYRQEWVCHGYPPHNWCQWENVAVPGWKQVEFHYETTTRTYGLLLDSHTGAAAEFTGSATDRRKVYTFEGACY